MPTYHILLAIDGTDSKDWRRQDGLNSHIWRFYTDFQGEKKYPMHGPGVTGLDVSNILDEGIKMVYVMINQVLEERGCSINDIHVNLVGHSRGGFIAIKIANMLANPVLYVQPAKTDSEKRMRFINSQLGRSSALNRINVNFLGLYDAVKRTATEISGDLTLNNVNRIAHATRVIEKWYSFASLTASRPSFDSIVIPKEPGKVFDLSHGGVGGDPGFFTPLEVRKDLYCNALDLIENPESSWRETISTPYKHIYTTHFKKNPDERIAQVRSFWLASGDADRYVRSIASNCGVPLPGSSQHLPWGDREYREAILLKSKLKLPQGA